VRADSTVLKVKRCDHIASKPGYVLMRPQSAPLPLMSQHLIKQCLRAQPCTHCTAPLTQGTTLHLSCLRVVHPPRYDCARRATRDPRLRW